ncbi:uncharacterized protein LOC102298534 [Haplochromis burtoni]|uniref:uncharacterized protein LOC102298534 n=1 Tax=Haplochromis burtoni TaxID=8153 RepID=UPI0003BDB8C4|nr:uncharacterized protein LOC102298534 [Haplochromis burtoni]
MRRITMGEYRAGFLKLACIWMAILMHGLDAQLAPKKHAAGASCSPKHLTALTESLVNESLRCFDEANGKHFGIWLPGFPELHVQKSFPPNWTKVHCSLRFMYEGLNDILEDQKNNLNPQNVSLHKKLEETIARIKMLANCINIIFKSTCPSKPSPPKMPKQVFERKQWSHTLLKAAGDYLVWLEQMFVSYVKGTKMGKGKVTKTQPHKYLEGSGYLL